MARKKVQPLFIEEISNVVDYLLAQNNPFEAERPYFYFDTLWQEIFLSIEIVSACHTYHY